MKKFLWLLAVAVMAGGLMVSQASAFSFDYRGDSYFKLTGYTNSVYDENKTLNTWAIVRLTGAYEASPSDEPTWTPNTTDYVYGAIWGLTDSVSYYDPLTNNYTIEMTGGQFALYSGSESSSTAWQNLINSSAKDGLDSSEVATLFSGYDDLILTGTYRSGLQGSTDATTLIVNALGLTTPTTGTGFGYADVTGGSFSKVFNSDLYKGGTDASILYNLTENATNGWGSKIEDPIQMTAVPEPATLLLLGVGLIGLGLGKRYRRD